MMPSLAGQPRTEHDPFEETADALVSWLFCCCFFFGKGGRTGFECVGKAKGGLWTWGGGLMREMCSEGNRL
jgi:hypothetical protein